MSKKHHHHITDNNTKNKRTYSSMSKNIPLPNIEKKIYLSKILSVLGNNNYSCTIFFNNQIYSNNIDNEFVIANLQETINRNHK